MRALYDKVLCANSDKFLSIMSSLASTHPIKHNNPRKGTLDAKCLLGSEAQYLMSQNHVECSQMSGVRK